MLLELTSPLFGDDPNVGSSMLIRSFAVIVAASVLATVASAQSAAEHVAAGDKAAVALNATAALANYKAAIAADSSNEEAYWKASRTLVDLGEYEPDKDKQKDLYAEAKELATKAVALKPTDPEAHFSVARAVGRVALSVGKKERVRFAKDVRTEAMETLRLDSVHAGANHVMGRWNAEIMRLSGFSRFMAKNFLGGDVFGTASWAEAVRYMERAVALDPVRITHHLDLAEVYRDRNKPGDKEKAMAQFQAVIDGQITDFNDAHYKKEAQDELARLK
jgi:tetratricopeptide (TPR) repeat protein